MINDYNRDKSRLREIERLQLTDGQVDDILNEYSRKAAEAFGLNIGLVSIVLENKQIYAASSGLTGWLKSQNAVPIELSFCAHSLRTRQPFVVEDAIEDELVMDNPVVKEDGVRCYAGVPLVTKNNFIIGNFCVMGRNRRVFSQEEIEKLRQFARIIIQHLESRIS